MSSTLIDSVKTVFTDVLISKFSALLGETESNTRKGLQAAISIVLTAVLHKTDYPAEAVKIYDLSKEAASKDFFGHIHELSVSSGGLTAGSSLLNKGTDFTNSLFSNRADIVVKEVSRYSGVSVSSSSFITGVVAFASLDAIGRQIANSNLDVKGMTEWLAAQRNSIIRAIPNGVEVKKALGISHYPADKLAKPGRNRTLYIIIVLAVIAVAIFLMYRTCNKTDIIAPVTITDSLQTSPAPTATTIDTIHLALPNGKALTADKGGTESQLINFLNDPNAKLDSKNGSWFNFTRISFADKSADILLGSEAQLKNIVAILEAFPKAKIRIGGFSDNVGDAAGNVKLTQHRADNILAKLKEFGAKGSQLDGAKGYGADMPIGDNGTDAGRAQNRRMAIDVKAK